MNYERLLFPEYLYQFDETSQIAPKRDLPMHWDINDPYPLALSYGPEQPGISRKAYNFIFLIQESKLSLKQGIEASVSGGDANEFLFHDNRIYRWNRQVFLLSYEEPHGMDKEVSSQDIVVLSHP